MDKRLADVIGLRDVADFRTIALIVVYWVLWTVGWVWVDSAGWMLVVPWFLLTSFFSFVCAIITHNTMHLSLFETKYYMRNIFTQHILSLSYGHPVSSYLPGHNLSHHKYTQTLKDHMRTTKVNYRWNFMNLLMFQPTVVMAVLKGDLRYVYLQKKLGKEFYYQCIREFLVVYVTSVALLYLSPMKFLIWWWLPHNFAQWAIVGINVIQHDGCEVNKPGEKEGNFSRNFNNPIEDWFFVGNSFHSAHHMKPQLHWSKLREFHNTHVAPKIHPELNRGSLCSYLFTAFIYPGKREMYDGRPYVFFEGTVGDDEEWLSIPSELTKEITVMNALKSMIGSFIFFSLKIMMPMYSPLFKLI